MAEVTFKRALAVGPQSLRGTIDSTINGLVDGGGSGAGGAIDSSDGLILGDPDEGDGTGVSLEFSRNLTERARLGLSVQPSDSAGAQLSSFELGTLLKGSGAATPSLPADFTPPQGLDTILAAAGLSGASDSGTWLYTLAPGGIFSAKAWENEAAAGNAEAWGLRDCIVDSLALSFTPQEAVKVKATMAGTFDNHGLEAWPALDYGLQATLTSPKLGTPAAGHNWGMSALVRPFWEGTLTIAQSVENLPDSEGDRFRQTARDITMDLSLVIDDADQDFEWTELTRTTAPTEPLSFRLGSAGDAAGANGILITLATPELRVLSGAPRGTAGGKVVTLQAVTTTEDAELTVRFD